MKVTSVITQLRTTDLDESIKFYTDKVGLTLAFRHSDFYAGIRAGQFEFHLKLVDETDPSIQYVENGEHFHLYLGTDDVDSFATGLKKLGVSLMQDVTDTAWGTRECVFRDTQGHTIYAGEARPAGGNQ